VHTFGVDGTFQHSTDGLYFDEWMPVPWSSRWVVLTDRLTIIDLSTGSIERTVSIPNYRWTGWSVGQTPVVVEDVAYLTHDNRVIAFDLR
jgi:hypothetical protein